MHLLFGVHRGHRILAVLYRRQGGFEHDVAHAGQVAAADEMPAIDANLDMQTVVLQQDRRGRLRSALKSRKAAGVLERGGGTGLLNLESTRRYSIGNRVAMAAFDERKVLIQKGAHEGDDPAAALWIVAADAARAPILRDHVGPVECVVKAAPARIGGIQGITRVIDGHHQLRAGQLRDFGIDVGGGDREWPLFGHEITDFQQERPVRSRIESRARVFLMPGVDLRLEQVATLQKRSVARRHAAHESGKSAPEACFVQA